MDESQQEAAQKQLVERSCAACRGDTPKLPAKKISEYMLLLEGWAAFDETFIERTYTFKNFKQALAFFNKVAEIAEEENHHPDMTIRKWRQVQFYLTTHAVDGLTDNDFIVAAKIDKLYRETKAAAL